MKSNLLAGSLCAAGIIIPQIIFAGDKNREVTPDKPNIIFILADDMGYGDLSCYGNQYVKTPNIDRLAETGTRFNQCYAGSGISSPSRCALMTGKNTGNTRIRDNMCTAEGIAGIKINPNGDSTIVRRANLLQQDTTIATVLSAAGYRTCLVNKWHLDGYEKEASPNHRGFDEFYGWTISTVHSNSPYYYPYYRFHGDSLIHIPENADGKHGIHNNDLSTNDAIAFVQRNKDNPFFLYLAFDAPHEPYNIDQTGWYEGQEKYQDLAKKLLDAAFLHGKTEPMSKTTAKRLYGQTLVNSVSRLEKFSACSYAHFLNYGLRVSQRDLFVFQPVDMGNIFHKVLESYARKVEASEYTWFNIPEKEQKCLAAETVEEVSEAYASTLLHSSARNEYVIRRMKRIMERTIWALTRQVRAGNFIPSNFEVPFLSSSDLKAVNIALSDEETMRLKGRIDRIDLYETEHI